MVNDIIGLMRGDRGVLLCVMLVYIDHFNP